MEFPQVDLPVDLIAWTDVTEDILNIYKQSCRLKACIFALCIEGSITVSINLMDTEIKQGDFVTLLPGTIIQFYGQKGKGPNWICRILRALPQRGVNIIQSTMNSYSKIIEAPLYLSTNLLLLISKTTFHCWHASPPDRICPKHEWRKVC